MLSQASSIPLGEDNSTDALNAPFETLLDANPISNQFEIAAMNIEYDFNLPAEDVVSYKGVKSNDNGDAGMVLVVEAADGLSLIHISPGRTCGWRRQPRCARGMRR